jgi:hypothetical protein
MQTGPRPAIVTLRMSRSLRDGLRSAAAAAGCSLNGYALQILAAAAGDPARFRRVAGTLDPADDLRDLERDERGFPVSPKARSLHIVARSTFLEAMMAEADLVTVDRLVREHDLEDPAFFVEWYRRRET